LFLEVSGFLPEKKTLFVSIVLENAMSNYTIYHSVVTLETSPTQDLSTSFSAALPRGNQSSQFIIFFLNAVLVAISLWIIGSNATLIMAIAKNRNLHRLPYTFIASLAMTDVLNGSLGGGIILSFSFYIQGNFNKTFCHANSFMILFPMLCSRFHLIIIGLDKLVSIVQPLR